MRFSKLEKLLGKCSEEEKLDSHVEVRLSERTIKKLAEKYERGDFQNGELGVVSLELEKHNGKLYFVEEQMLREKDKDKERFKERER